LKSANSQELADIENIERYDEAKSGEIRRDSCEYFFRY